MYMWMSDRDNREKATNDSRRMDEKKEGGARKESWQGKEVDRKGRELQGVQRARELLCKKCGEKARVRLQEGGEWEGRLEGRAAGRACICHLLLLQAKKAQNEQQTRKKRKRKYGKESHKQETYFKQGLFLF